MLKVNIVCPSCRRRYSVDVPGGSGDHSVFCPYCGSPYVVTIRTKAETKKQRIPLSGSAAVAAKVRRWEVVLNVVWIVLGVLQCVTLYAAAAGVWNIVNAAIGLRNVRNIQPGNPHVVPYFDQRKVWLIVLAVVNLVLGGVVGVVLVLGDWYLRDYVLRNRSAFEG